MVVGINKQETGFRFGTKSTTVLDTIAEYPHNGRIYKLMNVRTGDGLDYVTLRLYNHTGRFIKQIMVEPELAKRIFIDVHPDNKITYGYKEKKLAAKYKLCPECGKYGVSCQYRPFKADKNHGSGQYQTRCKYCNTIFKFHD